MRVLATILLVSTVVLGVHTLAQSDDGQPAMLKRVQALELQVEYLRSREASVSAYVLRNGERAAQLEQLVTKVRAEGFTKRAIPAPSREALLSGLNELAKDLAKDLPAPTDKEQLMLKRIGAMKTK
ncbi:MAG: hypothetical protein QNJ98_11260 [Planctomycetota bacterium]|nr:hypothetical protein [Planctomycetota bacterium]